MKDEKGYSIIEVIVAVLILGVIFVPMTQALMDGIGVHLRARTHLDYIYKGQRVIEEERNTYSQGGIPVTTSSVEGHLNTQVTYRVNTSGNLGDAMDFSDYSDRFSSDLQLEYDDQFLTIGSHRITIGTHLNERIVVTVDQVGQDKHIDVTHIKDLNSGESDAITTYTTERLLNHTPSNDLNLYLQLTSVDADSPTLSFEIVNAMESSDILLNVEPDPSEKVEVFTTRQNHDSGEVLLYRNVSEDNDVIAEEIENDAVLYDMEVEIQRLDPQGTYNVETIRTMQNGD